MPGVLKKPVVMISNKSICSSQAGWLLGRREQGGTTGKENLGCGKEKKTGELRTPLQASQQVWTVLQQLVPGCDQPT